jgi:hypothetical protein
MHARASDYGESTGLRGESTQKVLTFAFPPAHSHDGQAAVKCNLKANEGQLYFLERQLLFISKQPTLVSFNEISAIVLAR